MKFFHIHFEACEACVARLADLFLCLGVTAMALGWALRRNSWDGEWPSYEKLENDRVSNLSNWYRISSNSIATG